MLAPAAAAARRTPQAADLLSLCFHGLRHASSTSSSPPPPARRQSKYMGLHWHSGAKRFIAEVRHKGQRVLYKSFPPGQEEAAARAVDAALREHLGKDVLTNFDAGTGAFLDPRHALDKMEEEKQQPQQLRKGARGPAGAVTYVPEIRQYKAVVKQRSRPVLLGLFKTEKEATKVLQERRGGPVGKGGQAEAPKQSSYIGVSWDSHHLKWVARLNHGGMRVLSQAFGEKQEKEAAHTYDSYARKYHGNDALTNFDAAGTFLDPKHRVTRVDTHTTPTTPSSSSSSSSTGGGVDYRGVSWSREMHKWQAQIQVAGRAYNLGYFTDPKDAALSYDAAAREHHGTLRAKCNFDEGGKRNTNVRIKVNNSPQAKAKYALVDAVGGGMEEDKAGRKRRPRASGSKTQSK